MKNATRILCILLIAALSFSVTGCIKLGPRPQTTPEPTQAAQNTEVPETEAPASEAPATDVPATDVPNAEADAAFEEFDIELFRELATSSSDTYNQFIVSDPAKFGIDPADVTPGWGDYYTYEGHVEYMDTCREMLDKLAAIDREALSDQNRYAYDMLKRKFEMDLSMDEFFYYDEPMTPVNGIHSTLPLSMICFAFRQPEDVETYVFLMEDMPRIIRQLAAFEEEKAAQGLFMTETALDQVLESCRGFAEKGEDCFLISYFDTVAEHASGLGLTDAEISALRERNDKAVLEGILPAYSELADSLEANRDKCSEFVGAVGRSEKAKQYYDLSVQDEGATLDSISKIIKKVEDMGDSMITELIYAMYSDADAMNNYGQLDITFGSIEEDMEWLEEFTASMYPPCPEHTVKYVTVPEDIAEDFSPAAYLTPSFDEYYENVILINPTSDSSSQLTTLAHEGVPGHMYQFLYYRSMPGLSLSQQVMEPTGFAEGWTVFTEYFVSSKCDDIGSAYCTIMNADSVYGNIFLPCYLSLQVNHNGWDVDKVADYLSDMQMQDYADLFYEYSVTMPTYAMSYGIGFAYMYELYSTAAPKTDAQHTAYFEKLLSFGPTYLDILADYMK